MWEWKLCKLIFLSFLAQIGSKLKICRVFQENVLMNVYMQEARDRETPEWRKKNTAQIYTGVDVFDYKRLLWKIFDYKFGKFPITIDVNWGLVCCFLLENFWMKILQYLCDDTVRDVFWWEPTVCRTVTDRMLSDDLQNSFFTRLDTTQRYRYVYVQIDW